MATPASVVGAAVALLNEQAPAPESARSLEVEG